MKSARQNGFTSLNRKVDQDLTPIKSVGLLESHVNAMPRAALDIKHGQNMLKSHEALQTFVSKQMKVNKVLESHKEEFKFELEEKAEEEKTRQEGRMKLRKKIAYTKQERIKSAIERKE